MRDLRHVFNPGLTIFDQEQGKAVASIGPLPEGLRESYVDYAIISRLIRSRTGEALLGVVGLSHYGMQELPDRHSRQRPVSIPGAV